MTGRFHGLAVQHSGRGLAAFTLSFPNEGAERVVEGSPQVIERPFPENMIDGFPRWKVGGQIPPGNAAFDHIEDGIQDAPQIRAWSTAFGRFGKHRIEIGPLGLR